MTTENEDNKKIEEKEYEEERKRILIELRREYQNILNIENENDREKALRDFLKKYKEQAKQLIDEISNLEEKSSDKEDEKEKEEKRKKSDKKDQLKKVNQLIALGQFFSEEIKIDLMPTPQSSTIVFNVSLSLKNQEISFQEANLIVSKLSDFLSGEKPLEVFIDSEFEKRLVDIKLRSEKAAKKIFEIIIKEPSKFNTDYRILELISNKIFGESLQQHDSKKIVEKMDRFIEIRDKIKKLLDQYQIESKDLSEDDKEKISLAKRFINYDRSVSFSDFEDILNRIGIDYKEIREFLLLREELLPHLTPRDVATFLSDRFLTDLLHRAIVDFDINNIVRKYITYDKNGNPEFTHKNRMLFSKEIVKYYYLALRKVHENNSTHFSEAKNRGGNQIDYYFGGLQGLISDLANRLESEIFKNNPEVVRFLRDRSGRFTSSILNYAEIFHDLPLYARDAGSFEKWPEFLGRLFPSEMGEAFYGDPVMEVSRSVITLYLRRRIVMNGNRIPADLFAREFNESEVRYSHVDGENIKRLIVGQLEDLKRKGLIDNFEEWEVDRALNYSLGIGLASLIDPELISTADPNIGNDFRGIYPLASKLTAKHNWGLGRGYPAANLVPELMAFDVTMFPEERGLLRRWFKKRKWIPEKIREFVAKKRLFYGEKVWDELIDRDGSYQELLSMINIFPALTSRGGWRFIHLRGELTGLMNLDWESRQSWSEETWDKFFNEAIKRYGASSLWWWGGELAAARTHHYLEHYFGKRKDLIEKFEKGEVNIEIFLDGKKKVVSYNTLQSMIDFKTRGELFEKYMKRNPGDFMMIMKQLIPELLEVKGAVAFDDELGFFVSKADFEEKIKRAIEKSKKEKEAKGEKMTKKEMKELEEEYISKYEKLLRRWGGEENLVRLGQLRKFIFGNLDSVVGDYFKKQNKSESELSSLTLDKKIEIFLNYFQEESMSAFNYLKLLNKDKGVSEGDVFLNEAYIENPVFRKLLFGEGGAEGLFTILKSASYTGPETRDLFYFIAQSWWYKQGLVNPFNTDIDHYRVFSKLGKAGEDVLKRVLGDANAVAKMIESVAKLDSLLREAALHGETIDPKEFDKIHQTVWSTLKGIIGEDYANKANYILAQTIAKFYWEHSITRNTFINVFGLRIPTTLFLGKKISLSKLVTGNWKAHTMDTNAVRAYFRHLAYDLEVLPHEGPYSYSQLEKAFDATSDTYIATEFAPNAIYFVILFLLFTYLKRAIEEEEKKK